MPSVRAAATATAIALLTLAFVSAAEQQGSNVVLITLDGVRIEEMFGGLDEVVARAIVKTGAAEESPLWQRYWAPTPEARRHKLMPFLWGTLLAEHGSIAGNQALGSVMRVTNRHRFSYPGYAEIATGAAHDAEIDSNDNRRTPFPTVLEIVRRELGLDRPAVATFASWETFRWIAEHEEGATTVNAGLQAYDHPDHDVQVLSDWQFQARTPWDGTRHDAYTLRFARAHLATYHPRLLWIALDETDDWAHDGRYDRVLDTLARVDAALGDLWTWLQSQDQYPVARRRSSSPPTMAAAAGLTPGGITARTSTGRRTCGSLSPGRARPAAVNGAIRRRFIRTRWRRPLPGSSAWTTGTSFRTQAQR